ncbi:ABC transporter permease [Arenivirga flava]|uniref:Polyamine ABC transporter permease n=1 Tax=Arenivirga flava TaxID=1930060 RepID=A0AA37UDH8_9MICO|nr:ABC transporter permease [Arenivirga flava]GMA27218.1 polyamine ABC transporter permease [Arenivirga flava]
MTASAPAPFKKRVDGGAMAFRVIVALSYLFLLAPLLIVVVIAFSSNQYLSFPPEGFTLRWFAELPQQAGFMQGLQTSLITASAATLIVLVIGVSAALALDRYDVPGKAALSSFFLSPLLVPTIVIALGLVLVLGPLGLTNTYESIVLGHIGITLPYVVRTTLMSLATSDTSCEEAARVLGANAFTVFRRVTLPIIRPGVIAGGVIAFIVSFDEAVISLFVAESGRPTLPVQILRYVEYSADAAVAALSVVLIVFSAVVVVVVERLMGLKRTLA